MLRLLFGNFFKHLGDFLFQLLVTLGPQMKQFTKENEEKYFYRQNADAQKKTTCHLDTNLEYKNLSEMVSLDKFCCKTTPANVWGEKEPFSKCVILHFWLKIGYRCGINFIEKILLYVIFVVVYSWPKCEIIMQ